MSPRKHTLGSEVIQKHGIKMWWYVQRVLITWGLAEYKLGHWPTWEELKSLGENEGTLSRDLGFFREVFGDRSVRDVLDEIKRSRQGSVVDRVMTAPASVCHG